MSLVYTVVVQDFDGADVNQYVSSSRRLASRAYDAEIKECEQDGNTNQVRFEAWKDGKIVDKLTQIHLCNPKDEEEEDDYYDEEEDEECD